MRLARALVLPVEGRDGRKYINSHVNLGMVTSGECLEEKGQELGSSESAPWGSPLSAGVVSEGLSDEDLEDLQKVAEEVSQETHLEASLWAQIVLSHLGQLGALDKQDVR